MVEWFFSLQDIRYMHALFMTPNNRRMLAFTFAFCFVSVVCVLLLCCCLFQTHTHTLSTLCRLHHSGVLTRTVTNRINQIFFLSFLCHVKTQMQTFTYAHIIKLKWWSLTLYHIPIYFNSMNFIFIISETNRIIFYRIEKSLK